VDIFIIKTFCRNEYIVIFALPIRKNWKNKRQKYRTISAFQNLDSVAQLVEQYTFNVWVLGSSPNGITEIIKAATVAAFIILQF
jgi:hypothetical protein